MNTAKYIYIIYIKKISKYMLLHIILFVVCCYIQFSIQHSKEEIHVLSI